MSTPQSFKKSGTKWHEMTGYGTEGYGIIRATNSRREEKMAERRMFAKSVTQSARFLTLPAAARLLYYDLGMAADDDGVVEAFMVLRMTGAGEKAMVWGPGFFVFIFIPQHQRLGIVCPGAILLCGGFPVAKWGAFRVK